MIRFWILFFIFSLFAIYPSFQHHCGIGTFTTRLSQALSNGCDSHALSVRCCKPHDDCYEAAQIFYRIQRNEAIKKCDLKFNDCIWRSCYSKDQIFCRSWIYFTHGKATEYFNYFCASTGNVFCNRY